VETAQTIMTTDGPGARARVSGAAATTPPGASGLTPELESEIEAIVDHNGCELWHAEYNGGMLKLYIDRPDNPGGVDLSDCEIVSKQVSALLDVMDFGPGRYTLEVSSPGLDRRLYRPRDYDRFAGSLARVTYRDPATGRKRTDVGRLGGYREGERAIVLERAEGEEPVALPLDAVESTRLEIEL
jgi:ribosome maturation factor RimP